VVSGGFCPGDLLPSVAAAACNRAFVYECTAALLQQPRSVRVAGDRGHPGTVRSQPLLRPCPAACLGFGQCARSQFSAAGMQRSYSAAIAHNNGFSSENGPARSGGAEYTALRTATSTRARFGAVPLGLHGNGYFVAIPCTHDTVAARWCARLRQWASRWPLSLRLNGLRQLRLSQESHVPRQ
jgi:hypothetical protein